jgi:uncharacterized protein (DUF952 family)
MYIYHLAPAERWFNRPVETEYLPAEYENDGFIHCTAGADLMLAVANRFYSQVPGDFVLLALEEEFVLAPVHWEQGVPPDGSSPEADLAPIFPHIYGPINVDAVQEILKAVRAEDGSFVAWQA